MTRQPLGRITELAARLTVAQAVSADFTREIRDETWPAPGPDWLAWSHRLNTALAGLASAIDVASAVAPDGSLTLAPRDLPVVLDALADAARYRNDHQPDSSAGVMAEYRRLARALGDGR
jgi:hypothetical protein